jgi:hypothetical protein
MTKDQLFYPTKLKLTILELLARFEVLTTRDLAQLIYQNDSINSIRTINRTLANLNSHSLVNQIFFRPEDYLGRGNLPNASGLSEQGVAFAEERWPATYPKEFPRTHSPHTIEHDLRRARTHIAIDQFSRDNKLTLGWKKGGNHIVKPDDTFELTKEKTAHFFLEEEYKRKDFDALYEKLKPYVSLHGSAEIKKEWGFRYYTVVVPMRDADAMQNILTHFKGGCNCVDPKLKYMHRSAPFKLHTDVIAFTTHQEIIERTSQPILYAPSGKIIALLDIVK